MAVEFSGSFLLALIAGQTHYYGNVLSASDGSALQRFGPGLFPYSSGLAQKRLKSRLNKGVIRHATVIPFNDEGALVYAGTMHQVDRNKRFHPFICGGSIISSKFYRQVRLSPTVHGSTPLQ